MMSGKLLKEVTKIYINEDGCFASHSLFQVITSLEYSSF
jgi:hypothetical protein